MIKTPTVAIVIETGERVDVYFHRDGKWHGCTMHEYSWNADELKFLNDERNGTNG